LRTSDLASHILLLYVILAIPLKSEAVDVPPDKYMTNLIIALFHNSMLNLFSPSFSAEELLGITVVELVKKEGSSLGIVISGEYCIWQCKVS
jgi:hypothetical protein